MRVGIASVHTPGIHGGAEYLVDGLVEACREAGHQIHKISVPFVFEPPEAAGRTMDLCQAVDFSRFGGGQVDVMIALKFPAYLIGHPDKRVWLLHQHRAAYDLFDTIHGWHKGKARTDALRQRIVAADGEALADVPVFTISQRVSDRLAHYNGIASTAIYHPPADATAFRCAEDLGYVLVPSRLERLKRQDLVLEALAQCTTPINALFVGDGSMRAALERQAEALGLGERVRFLGSVSRQRLIELYAHARAVYFGPFDEDYGYITLEAMLASKPVITCTDSGGPLEFVVDGETGVVVAPDPRAIAGALEQVMGDAPRARQMGQNGLARYRGLDISWHTVVETLLAPKPSILERTS